MPSSRATSGFFQYCASTCARFGCTRHAGCVDSKPKTKKKTTASSQTKNLPVQCTMTKSGDTTFAHIQGPATQRPADAWITTAALHFISVLFCCAACLQVSSALEEFSILHHGPQARRVNTTTTLLVARAPKPVAVCSQSASPI